jgi:hypothetical protein
LAVGVIPGDGTEVRKGSTYKQGGVGEERGSKEMDGCPLTVSVDIIYNNAMVFIYICYLHLYIVGLFPYWEFHLYFVYSQV